MPLNKNVENNIFRPKYMEFVLEMNNRRITSGTDFKYKSVEFPSIKHVYEYLKLKESRLISHFREEKILLDSLNFEQADDEIFFEGMKSRSQISFNFHGLNLKTKLLEWKNEELKVDCYLGNSYFSLIETPKSLKIGTSYIDNTIEHIDLFKGSPEFDNIPKSLLKYQIGTFFFGKVKKKDSSLLLKITKFVIHLNKIISVKMDLQEKTFEIHSYHREFFSKKVTNTISKFKMNYKYEITKWEGYFDNIQHSKNEFCLVDHLDNDFYQKFLKQRSKNRDPIPFTVLQQHFDGNFLVFEGISSQYKNFIYRYPMNKRDSHELYISGFFNSFWDIPKHGYKSLTKSCNFLHDIKFKYIEE